MYQFTKNRSLLATLLVIGLSSLLTGCTTYSYTSRSTSIRPNEISSRSLGAEINVDFSRRVTATSDPQILKSDAINDAQYKCINANNIDVVVDPIYQIEFSMFQKKAYKATVVGYAGTYRQVPTGVDAVVEKNYNIEDIEKYKLINDPTFYQYYYQKDPVQGGDVTNYYINSNGNGGAPIVTKSQPTSMMIRPTAVPEKMQVKPAKKFDYMKSKQLRNGGIFLTTFGVATMFLVGAPMIAGYNKYNELFYNSEYYDYNGYYHRNYDYLDKRDQYMTAHLVLCPIGLACLVSGIPMWAVGSHRMKKASAPQLAIGGTKDGLGMRLTF